ncbi:hypothetical protein M9991_01210 [Chryseobacterium gallinarum]|uniref:hypothetical protein n=1 Tax=Chryseobacterium gallinarum TaxID=1324352 RepID=UPI002025B39C|nr:hypothetical protein [Chryseobacterium gallinarum]MCL8535481.1 hypothetical protein [Chryseobacterium gallinarum]
MKQIFFITTIIFLFSCSTQKDDILGRYVFEGTQTIDSLIIEKNIYVHKIFNKQGTLKYQGQSTWELEKNRIIFLNFYNNEDSNLEEFLTEEDVKRFLIRLSCPIYTKENKTIIEVNADENVIYYKKNK